MRSTSLNCDQCGCDILLDVSSKKESGTYIHFEDEIIELIVKNEVVKISLVGMDFCDAECLTDYLQHWIKDFAFTNDTIKDAECLFKT